MRRPIPPPRGPRMNRAGTKDPNERAEMKSHGPLVPGLFRFWQSRNRSVRLVANPLWNTRGQTPPTENPMRRFVLFALLLAAPARAADPPAPVGVEVDLSDVGRRVVHTKVTFP